MNIDTSSYTSNELSELRQRSREFKKGKVNLSEDDLEDFKTVLSSEGADTNAIDRLIATYDKVDLNGDGISIDEFKTYKKTTAGSSLEDKGLTKEQMQKMNEEMTANGMEVPSAMRNIFENFSAVETDQNGSVTHSEMETYATANGIDLPKGPPPRGPRPPSESNDQSGSSIEDIDLTQVSPEDLLFKNQTSSSQYLDSLYDSSGLLKNIKA